MAQEKYPEKYLGFKLKWLDNKPFHKHKLFSTILDQQTKLVKKLTT